MKTTVELPESLIKRVKLRAIKKGQKLKVAIAELLRQGLDADASAKAAKQAEPEIVTDKVTGLPVIVCKRAALPHEELTPERVADILLAQEVEWFHASGR